MTPERPRCQEAAFIDGNRQYRSAVVLCLFYPFSVSLMMTWTCYCWSVFALSVLCIHADGLSLLLLFCVCFVRSVYPWSWLERVIGVLCFLYSFCISMVMAWTCCCCVVLCLFYPFCVSVVMAWTCYCCSMFVLSVLCVRGDSLNLLLLFGVCFIRSVYSCR